MRLLFAALFSIALFGLTPSLTGPPGQPIGARDVRCSYPNHGGLTGKDLAISCGIFSPQPPPNL